MTAGRYRRWPVVCKKIAPKSHDELQELCGGLPAQFARAFTKVDKKVSCPKDTWAFAVYFYVLCFKPLITNKMFSAVRKGLNDREPQTFAIDPFEKGPAISNAQFFPCDMISSKPVTPNPFVEMVRGNRTMDRAASRLLISHKLVEMLDKHGVKFFRVGDVKHGPFSLEALLDRTEDDRIKSGHDGNWWLFCYFTNNTNGSSVARLNNAL